MRRIHACGLLCVTLVITLSLLPAKAQADAVNPWAFNVYSLGDIGTSGSGYGSDYQGAAGAAGNAYFSGFSLNDLNYDVVPGYSLHTGGNVSIMGSINNGGIDAGGNVAINGASVFGNVSAAGNLTGTGGTITGNASLGGNKLVGPAVTVTGSLTQNTSYTPLVDFNSVSSFFSNYNTYVSSLADTTGIINSFGELQINAASGINVVSLASTTLNSAWGVTISGPSDAIVYINLTDASAAFDSLVWSYSGGVTSSDALLNLVDADTLALSGGNHLINILAPDTDVTFSYGLVTGNLVAGNLYGGGQVNHGFFDGPTPSVPEPASMAGLLLGLGLLLLRRRPHHVG
ncbi:MAG: choice-of-anchor A family protein [Phycisphaeraceae bacterium]|nr:choice-of-anchor A family protein [Phycisphaeraceae bacterium]